jgi:adenosylhomocysteine nucleosidase
MIVVIVALESELSSQRWGADVQLVHSGVGKVNATMATCEAIARYSPSRIVNYGTAGAVSGRAGGLMEVGRVIQRDMMAMPLAPRGVTPFSNDAPAIESGVGGVVCATGDSFVTEPDQWLIDQQVDIVDMELYAIAQVCRVRNLPWSAFKFVTDEANDSAAAEWSKRVGGGEALFRAQLQRMLPGLIIS